MTTLRAEDLYHTGVVVPDLDAAIGRMQAVAGYRFTMTIESPFPVRTAHGDTVVDFRFVYSLDAPHIELVQALPGTVWTPAPGNAAHHLGYFVDDLSRASDDLVAAGMPREVCGLVDGETAGFAYHKGDDGIRIEIVDRALMPDWAAFLRSVTPV